MENLELKEKEIERNWVIKSIVDSILTKARLANFFGYLPHISTQTVAHTFRVIQWTYAIFRTSRTPVVFKTVEIHSTNYD